MPGQARRSFVEKDHSKGRIQGDHRYADPLQEAGGEAMLALEPAVGSSVVQGKAEELGLLLERLRGRPVEGIGHPSSESDDALDSPAGAERCHQEAAPPVHDGKTAGQARIFEGIHPDDPALLEDGTQEFIVATEGPPADLFQNHRSGVAMRHEVDRLTPDESDAAHVGPAPRHQSVEGAVEQVVRIADSGNDPAELGHRRALSLLLVPGSLVEPQLARHLNGTQDGPGRQGDQRAYIPDE
jgi:hypothetical protein